MKIRSISIANVTSYNEETKFCLENGLNILIGPNGGGKSNLQKVLTLVLIYFFFQQFDFQDNPNEPTIKPIDLWNRRQIQAKLDRFFDNESIQKISLEIVPEESDLENILLIANNLDRLNKVAEYWEFAEAARHKDKYSPADYVTKIRAAGSLTYDIIDLELNPKGDSAEWAFYEYLRTFHLFKRLASRLPDVELTYPVFFFFSERVFNRAQRVQTQQLTEQHYYQTHRQAFQSAIGDNTDLFQLGAVHFLRLFRKHERRAAYERNVIVDDLIGQERDVQLLDKYLTKLGYDWGFVPDADEVNYHFVLKKNEHVFTPERFSSGEKEMVHFLLANFALNVRSGVIVIDEPELHLHPRWQRILLDLFEDLSRDRSNQFIVATHSPVFVTPETINNVTRVYANPIGASQQVALKDVNLPNKRALIRMINSQNNERIFFADKVVLVEGVTDRLVISSLIANSAAKFSDNRAIDVIDVGGKNNFVFYSDLLLALNTPCFILADRDYLEEVGSQDVKQLFVRDDAAAWKALTTKKSTDGAALKKALTAAIAGKDIAELQKFSAYLEGRHWRLKDELTAKNWDLLRSELDTLARSKIHILLHGDIEDYLPIGSTQLDDVIDLLAEKDWLLKLNSERRGELIDIACGILDVESEKRQTLKQSFDAGNRAFSELTK